MPVRYSCTAYVCRGQYENAHVIINPSHNPPLRDAAVGNRETIIARKVMLAIPAAARLHYQIRIYYYCYLLSSARLCDYCTIHVAELITLPLDSALSPFAAITADAAADTHAPMLFCPRAM